MALKLERFIGGVSASDTADDAAHGIELGKLSRGSAFRVSEYAGQDVFFKITLMSKGQLKKIIQCLQNFL